MRIPTLLALVSASACAPAPMTPERAERLCAERVGLADGIEGTIEMGFGSGGSRTGASITLTKRILAPQTEDEFMAECVGDLLEGRSASTGVNISATHAI